jgi:hypothetical protein
MAQTMNQETKQICIAKKVVHNQVEFLDFALDDNDKLIIFSSFKDAFEFLKSNVEEKYHADFIITSVQAQENNPRMKQILGDTQKEPAQPMQFKAQNQAKENEGVVECYFLLDCKNYKMVNTDSIVDLSTGKQLIPVLAFVEASNPKVLVQVPNFILKSAFIGEVEETEK